jgi:hypothetical protein
MNRSAKIAPLIDRSSDGDDIQDSIPPLTLLSEVVFPCGCGDCSWRLIS